MCAVAHLNYIQSHSCRRRCFFIRNFRKRHGALYADRRNLQSLHAIVRQVALRELQRRRLRDGRQRLPGMLEGIPVFLVRRPSDDVGDRDGCSAGMLRAEHRP